MNIDELSEELKKPYTLKRGFGIMKVDDYDNVYFVIPPPPPKKIEDNVPYSIVGKALKVLGQLPTYDEMSEIDRLINYLFVRREVVQSSRLEGTWSTIDHALTPGEIIETDDEKNAWHEEKIHE